jgi:hypothetical protein
VCIKVLTTVVAEVEAAGKKVSNEDHLKAGIRKHCKSVTNSQDNRFVRRR